MKRLFLWSAVTSTTLCLSLADAQQPTTGDKAAGKELTMLGTAVPVTNLDKTLQFYTKGLGMQATPRREMKEVTEEPLTFPGGGPYLILLLPMTPAPSYSPPPTQRVILDVPDLKALESQLRANGYSLEGTISENVEHHYAVARVNDPDGNHLELVQRPH